MKINKSSWHYKLNKWDSSWVHEKLRRGRTVGLCEYFWGTVKSALSLTMWVAIASICFSLLCWFVLLFIIGLSGFFITLFGGEELLSGLPLEVTKIFSLSLFIIIFYITIASIYLTIKGEIPLMPTWLSSDDVDIIKPVKEPSLFMSYYKAWKSKVCPIIELED